MLTRELECLKIQAFKSSGSEENCVKEIISTLLNRCLAPQEWSETDDLVTSFLKN